MQHCLTRLAFVPQLLSTRTYKGLDPNEGKNRPLDVIMGRVGIASAYAHEPGGKEKLVNAGQPLPDHNEKRGGGRAEGEGSSEGEGGGGMEVSKEKEKSESGGLGPGRLGDGEMGIVGEEVCGVEGVEEEELNMEGAGEALDDFFDAFD